MACDTCGSSVDLIKEFNGSRLVSRCFRCRVSLSETEDRTELEIAEKEARENATYRPPEFPEALGGPVLYGVCGESAEAVVADHEATEEEAFWQRNDRKKANGHPWKNAFLPPVWPMLDAIRREDKAALELMEA